MFAEDLGHSEAMDGRRALARAFGEYVDAQHWTQADVVEKGGPSTTTQSKIRRGNDPLSRQTLKLIDDVTKWPAGTAAAILSGTPEPASPPDEEVQGDSLDGVSNLALLAQLAKRLDRLELLEDETHAHTAVASQKSPDEVDDYTRAERVRSYEVQVQPSASAPHNGL